MAADTLNKLVQNRDTIRKIMAMDSNGKMDTMLENAVKTGNVSFSQDGVNYNGSSNYNDDGRVVVNEEIMKNSRMPKKILESFQQNPGTSTKMPTSILDGLELKSLDEMRNESSNNNITMNPMTQTGGNVIDYSLLRTIINEAVQENVKKYMSALSKKLLSEGVNLNNPSDTIQAVKLGKKFSFITENGDVYEATLAYKTNINESKNKKTKK